MNKAKVFSTLTAVTVGAIAASGLVILPTTARADQHQGSGEKSCSGQKDNHDCKDGHDKDGKTCSDHHGDKSCSGQH